MHGYNADLYDNYTMASIHPNGLVGLSILIQIGQLSNSVLRKITEVLPSIQYRGMVLVVVLCRVKSLKLVRNFSNKKNSQYLRIYGPKKIT